MNRDYLWRYKFLGFAISILPLIIGIQLFRIQIDKEQIDAIGGIGALYAGEFKTIEPARGMIYDRYGNSMAGNETVYEVGVELKFVRNPDTIALAMNLVTGADYNEIFESASIPESPTAVYRVLARGVTPEQVERLEIIKEQMQDKYGNSNAKDAPSLSGIRFSPYLERIYPEKSIGSNMIGFVNFDQTGYFGVEGYYNDMLAGKSTVVWLPTDPNQAKGLPNTPDGVSLVLTIDREIQSSMEELVDKAKKKNGAESATIVVLDPETGEILAMATTPRLDPNEYWDFEEIFPGETPFNRAVSQAYEPGSVYKVLTMAAGLDLGVITPETEFIDTGVFDYGGAKIYNWNLGAWGPVSMLECLQHSLNTCHAWVATKIGAYNFYDYMHKYGIGRSSGVDLAGEATGRLKKPGDEDWFEADLAVNSFGQGVAATPIQMASAISALANDGVIMTPHIVHSLISKGVQHEIGHHVASEPIKPETARTITEMLATSLEIEASNALVPGYRVAGKTGTGEIPTPYGYTNYLTNASFVGWGPVDDPQFLVYVWLEKPTTSIWGSEVAAPVFKDAVERLVVLMNIPPDAVRLELSGKQTSTNGESGVSQ